MAAAGLPVRLVPAGRRVTATRRCQEVAFGAGRARPGRRPGRRRRARPDGRLHGRRGAGGDARRPARSTSTRGRAAGSGARARRAATSCGSSTSPRTATATRCSSPSTRSARPAIAGRGAASTPTARPADRPTQGFAWLETLWATIAGARGRAAGGLVHGAASSTAASTRSARKVTEEATEVLIAAKDDAVAEAAGRGPRATRARRSPARPPTSCTTRSSCSPSAA